MKIALVLAMAGVALCQVNDWSWGSDKNEENILTTTKATEIEVTRVAKQIDATEVDVAKLNGTLPSKNTQGRIFGLHELFCDMGVGFNCKNKKDKVYIEDIGSPIEVYEPIYSSPILPPRPPIRPPFSPGPVYPQLSSRPGPLLPSPIRPPIAIPPFSNPNLGFNGPPIANIEPVHKHLPQPSVVQHFHTHTHIVEKNPVYGSQGFLKSPSVPGPSIGSPGLARPPTSSFDRPPASFGRPPISSSSAFGRPPISSSSFGGSPTSSFGRPPTSQFGQVGSSIHPGFGVTNLGNIPPHFGPTDLEVNTNYLQQYREDCQCVPFQYCQPGDAVARNDPREVTNLINPRTKSHLILSNDTYSEIAGTTTHRASLPVEHRKENAKSKREVGSASPTSIQNIKKDPQPTGRQLGYSPGSSGCAPDHVCCRNPIFSPSQSRDDKRCGRGNSKGLYARVLSRPFERSDTQFGEFPWQAAILQKVRGENVFVCGATLIDEKHLLTAAHCIEKYNPFDLKIRLGEWDVNKDTEFYPHVEADIRIVQVHPNYYSGNLENDIALITINGYVDLLSHPHINPICMPETYSNFAGQRCLVTGWGKDAFSYTGGYQHVLKKVDVPVLDKFQCQEALKRTKLGPQYSLPLGMLCAGGEEGKDACKGDGGGPLVCLGRDGSYQLAGLVSWGMECGHRGIPGVYVDIPYYMDWLKANLRQ